MITWDVGGDTHRGRVRRRNEDSFRVDGTRGIFVVADGMGGHAAGNIASSLAANAVVEVLNGVPADVISGSLGDAYAKAQQAIVDCCRNDPATEGMGTTLTVALLDPAGKLTIGHLGDSRLYCLREGQLHQLTHDHTWVQQEIDAGRLSYEAGVTHPLSHILTRVLTADEPAFPDLQDETVFPGDVLLLCSDGLYNMVAADFLRELLSYVEPADSLVGRLLQAANNGGGSDNITAVVIKIQDPAFSIRDSG